MRSHRGGTPNAPLTIANHHHGRRRRWRQQQQQLSTMQRWWRELQQQSNVGVSTNGSGTTEQAAVDSPKKTPWRTTTLDPVSDGLYKPIRIQFDISDLLKQLETALYAETNYTDTIAKPTIRIPWPRLRYIYCYTKYCPWQPCRGTIWIYPLDAKAAQNSAEEDDLIPTTSTTTTTATTEEVEDQEKSIYITISVMMGRGRVEDGGNWERSLRSEFFFSFFEKYLCVLWDIFGYLK